MHTLLPVLTSSTPFTCTNTQASSLVMPSTNGNGKAHLPTPADEAVHAILQPLKTFG